MSVPKILTLFIPEILSHPAIAGRARTLPVPPVGRPVGRRGKDVGNVKASRSRDLAQSRSSEDRSGPFVGSFPVLGEAHRGRSSGCACRWRSRALEAADRQTQHRRGFPETRHRDPGRKGRPTLAGDPSASSRGGLPGRQDRPVCFGGFSAPERDKAPGSFRGSARGI